MRLRAFGVLLAAVCCVQCGRAPLAPKVFKADRPLLTCELRESECIIVDTASRKLQVFRKGEKVYEVPRVALSPEGAGAKAKRGDGIVPKGTFRLARIHRATSFGIFLQIDYPTIAYAERGLHAGVITQKDYRRILRAHERGELPPQDTPLGGQLGIHGLGTRSVETHRISNWTRGCVALENEEMKELLPFLRLRMEVTIR